MYQNQNDNMKGSLIILILLFNCFLGISQDIAIKMKLYYWNASAKHFDTTLTKNGKVLLDSVLSYSKIDTSKCIKVAVKDITEFTSKKFLSNHSYTYLSYSNYNGEIKNNYYQSYNGFHKKDNCKLILYHATDKNLIDVVTLYEIE